MYKSYYELDAPEDKNTDQYSVVELNNFQEKQKLIRAVELVVIDHWATWCQPCVEISPSYAILAKTYNKKGEVALVKYNWDKMTDAEKKAEQINVIPIFHFYLQGVKVDEVIGADIEGVENILKKYITKVGKTNQVSVNTMNGPQYNRSSIRNNTRSNINVPSTH